MRQSQKPNSTLKGHETTVAYLQRLGKDHFDLIKEYSQWVLKAHPEDGLKVRNSGGEGVFRNSNLPLIGGTFAISKFHMYESMEDNVDFPSF